MKLPRQLPSLTSALLIIVVVLTSLVLVVGRDVSHRLTLAVCTDTGECGTFPQSPPVCQYHGRDRAVARASFAFAQQQPAESARLVQYGDDSASVVVTTEPDVAEVYTFQRWENAQRWVLDHSSALGDVANAAAGPTGQPVRDGYLQMLQLLQLDHQSAITPESTVRNITDPAGEGSAGAVHTDDQGAVTKLSVIIPDGSATPELRGLMDELGMWGFFSYTVELGADLAPRRLKFEGPAVADWSLDQLRSSREYITAVARPEEAPNPQTSPETPSILRSYALDLTRTANEALYREIFAMESIGGAAAPLLTAEDRLSNGERRELYTGIADRIRTDAVLVETGHRIIGSGDVTPDMLTETAKGLVLRDAPIQGPSTRLVDARTADLSIASSRFEPLLTCEVEPDSEGDSS